MEKENKKWKVEFSKNVTEKLGDLPDDAYDELVKVVKGFKEGKLDPKKIGQPMDLADLDTKLKCPKCDSEEVEWMLDKNSNEVDFHCLKCGECFWMTHNEYKDAIKRNPSQIIK